MYGDEREETLREVSALGNAHAVHHFTKAGVNLNSRNKMNGWTALHWAAHRGHEKVVRLLLANGADPNVKTNKGQTAFHLTKDPAIQNLLDGDTSAKQEQEGSAAAAAAAVGPEPALPIVPTYMKEPDLEKSWLHPDEFSEAKIENVVRRHMASQQQDEPSTTTTTTTTTAAATTTASTPQVPNDSKDEEKEILVYLGSKMDENIVGSVFLKNESIESSVKAIQEELDGLPENFSLARNNGKVTIPINTKQMDKRLLDIFRGDQDVLVVVPK
ncbi:hypothetical protein BDB00DRAFT_849588 [Zychaea mexicana]|uniref:uncharacterized protein n=1 Tax=Zychaea mexicana TaxID=64656 RepID=UPI0022FE7505|nr:uncharacterized protein BDB00DRAFT_849588 [Zychaea mexicana]KAI9488174.1 hypothetical protein BDB00DRAFT_849588 [Zychaea mexicana]